MSFVRRVSGYQSLGYFVHFFLSEQSFHYFQSKLFGAAGSFACYDVLRDYYSFVYKSSSVEVDLETRVAGSLFTFEYAESAQQRWCSTDSRNGLAIFALLYE